MTITLRREGSVVQTINVSTEIAVLYMPSEPYQLEVRRGSKGKLFEVPATPASRLNEPLPGITYFMD
jgi:hypothetical protein